MDELGKWFMEVFTSINSGGRLGPPAASGKRVKALLEEIGGEGVMKLAAMLNVGNPKAVRRLAGCRPDLGEELKGEEPQEALDAYLAERAEVFEPCRKFVARALSLPTGSTTIGFAPSGESDKSGDEAWEKVFRLLTGGESDGKESCNL